MLYSLGRSIDCDKCYKEDKQDDMIKRPAGSWGDTSEGCFRRVAGESLSEEGLLNLTLKRW